MRIRHAAMALSAIVSITLAGGALAQRAQPMTAWAPQPAKLAPFTAPNKLFKPLSAILARHKGQKSWAETEVLTRDYIGQYIQMAPGEKTKTLFWADDRAFWVVESGALRFTIEGQEPFVATKGFLVQVPYRVPYSMETVGDEPALRFEVRASYEQPSYPTSETPPKDKNWNYVQATYTGKGKYDADNKPFLDFQKDIVQGGGRGGGFVKDDHTWANVIRGAAAPLPADTSWGHFHENFPEFWIVLEGEEDFLIQGEKLVQAHTGDIVFAPDERWHRATNNGPIGTMSTRLAITPRPPSLHYMQPGATGGENSPNAVSDFAAPGSPAFRRISLALFLAGFATFSLLYCVQPLLPLLAAGFGVTPAASSLALSFSTGALALAVLMAGPYSEWVGRRGLMAVSIAAASLCDIGAAFAPDWRPLLILRAAEGYALGGVPGVAMAYLAEEIAPRGLGQAMGLYVGGTALGGMAGRVLGGLLSEVLGWRGAVAMVGLSGLVLAVAFAMVLPASRHFTPKPGFRPRYHFGAWLVHLRHPGLPPLFAIGGLVMGAFICLYNYAGFLLEAPPYNLSPSQIGLIFLVYLAGFASSALAGRLSDRLGRLAVLLAGLATCLLGMGLTLFAPLTLVILGTAFVTTGFFAAHAVASSWVGALAASDKGHATSLYLLTYYLGSSLAGSLGGWFWAADRWPGVVGFCALLVVLAVVAALRLRKNQPRPR